MIFRLLADFFFIAHLCFVLFAIFGGLLVLRRRRLIWLHLPTVAWAAAVEFFQLSCPLTTLENHFKRLGGEQGYEGGFIEHYISAILYIRITPEIQISLGVILVIFNLLIYRAYFKRTRSIV